MLRICVKITGMSPDEMVELGGVILTFNGTNLDVGSKPTIQLNGRIQCEVINRSPNNLQCQVHKGSYNF